jgi:acyl-CoA reductase-like NAD-dependent aldehyde dehydrogenase
VTAVESVGQPVFDATSVRNTPYPQFIAGAESATGSTHPLTNPCTGEPVANWSEATDAEIDAAVAAARASYDDGRWRRLPGARRAEILERASVLLRARVPELIGLDSISTGKVFLGGITYDGYEAVNTFIGAASALRESVGEVREAVFPPGLFPEHGPRIVSIRSEQPAGVVVELLPWNAPLFTGSERVSSALAAGCSVVAKPSEESPASLVELAAILREAGLPDGVFNVVLGRGEDVGDRLVRDPRVDLVSLTGAIETGRRVYEVAASQMKRVNLELGGKAPVIVFADANLENVAMWAMLSAFNNMGEVCVAGTRLIVEAPVYDDVVAVVADAAASLPIGDQFDPQTFIGPLVNVAHADRVRGFVDRAVTSGAASVVGAGTVPSGLGRAFVAPTVLGNLRAGCEIEQSEVFGPVIAAHAFSSEDEAVLRANSTPYGLSASVFTGDIGRAFRVADRLEVGNVQINHHYSADHSVPRGTPRRKSGTGFTGIRGYQAAKSIDFNIGA